MPHSNFHVQLASIGQGKKPSVWKTWAACPATSFDSSIQLLGGFFGGPSSCSKCTWTTFPPSSEEIVKMKICVPSLPKVCLYFQMTWCGFKCIIPRTEISSLNFESPRVHQDSSNQKCSCNAAMLASMAIQPLVGIKGTGKSSRSTLQTLHSWSWFVNTHTSQLISSSWRRGAGFDRISHRVFIKLGWP